MRVTSFEPNEAAYLAFREGAPPDCCQAIERVIAAGGTVEEMVEGWAHEPWLVQQVIGAALAYWVLRAQEEG